MLAPRNRRLMQNLDRKPKNRESRQQPQQQQQRKQQLQCLFLIVISLICLLLMLLGIHRNTEPINSVQTVFGLQKPLQVNFLLKDRILYTHKEMHQMRYFVLPEMPISMLTSYAVQFISLFGWSAVLNRFRSYDSWPRCGWQDSIRQLRLVSDTFIA